MGVARLALIFAMVLVVIPQTISTISPAFATSPSLSEKMPASLLRVAEAFRVAAQLSDRLWVERIPYEDVPVVLYDLRAGEEYLINHPTPDPTKFEPTSFAVQGRPVFKKKGSPTLPVPMLVCCHTVSGTRTIVMESNIVPRTDLLIATFLHEGFHFFQMRSLFVAGADIQRYQQTIGVALAQYPWTSYQNEADLVVEGRILGELSGSAIGTDKEHLIQLLRAVESIRRSRLPNGENLYEDVALLMEGTAFYVESKAVQYLSRTAYETLIPEGADPQYSHFKDAEILSTYDASVALKEKIKRGSGLSLVQPYVYGKQFSIVLDEIGKGSDSGSWQEGLFPKTGEYLSHPEEATKDFLENIRKNSLSRKLSLFSMGTSPEAQESYSEAFSRFFSESDREKILKKLRIEAEPDSFPVEKGWSYRIKTRQFGLIPVLSNPATLEYYGTPMKSQVYLGGFREIRTSNDALLVEQVRIPVVIDLDGTIRFKDVGHGEGDAELRCENQDSAGRCDLLSLDIGGLRLTAKRAMIAVDRDRAETVIDLL